MAARRELAYLLRHHAWATRELIDFCAGLPSGLAGASAPGTYGPILRTLGHLVGADEFYAFLATSLRPERELLPDQPYDLAELRERAAATAARWERLLETATPVDRVVEPAGRFRSATVGVILVQALTHAAEHRTQVAVVLGQHGVEPPDVSGWAYGRATGEVELR